ncbi:hypothetical protein PINS_up003226 [Pythium insidiosum]|nr:hypothetical protein PINS_up003226 [Pythium insidiosum]
MDLRGALEQFDAEFTGLVLALDFKHALLGAGFAQFIPKGSKAEAWIGMLVRHFRQQDKTDGVQYLKLLGALSDDVDPSVIATVEELRSRIRRKAGFTSRNMGTMDVHAACKAIDPAFAHFDRQQKGFIGADQVDAAVQALNMRVRREDIERLVRAAAVYSKGAASSSISRTEFDAFVLVPFVGHLMRRLSSELYAAFDSMPRIARLSRKFMERDEPKHRGVVEIAAAIQCIEQVLGRSLAKRDQRRLQILFDINRDGNFAFKLFLKTMSQWRSTADTGARDLHIHNSASQRRHIANTTHSTVCYSSSALQSALKYRV